MSGYKQPGDWKRTAFTLAIVVLGLVVLAVSQDTPKSPAPAPEPAKASPVVVPPALAIPSAPAPAFLNGVTVSDPFYPFPPEDKIKIRDFQYESDQLEIQNQKLQLQIEQNKARQGQLLDAQKAVAFNFATLHKIDLDLYDFDMAQVRMSAKKKSVPGNGK